MGISFSVHHTSASLTINENYDSDVRDDTETFLNNIVPEVAFFPFLFPFYCWLTSDSDFHLAQGSSAPWKHTLEGHYHQINYLIIISFLVN